MSSQNLATALPEATRDGHRLPSLPEGEYQVTGNAKRFVSLHPWVGAIKVELTFTRTHVRKIFPPSSKKDQARILDKVTDRQFVLRLVEIDAGQTETGQSLRVIYRSGFDYMATHIRRWLIQEKKLDTFVVNSVIASAIDAETEALQQVK